jgi:Ran GTPase-activating protein (RanGAP) involved in mRNA processing and transport
VILSNKSFLSDAAEIFAAALQSSNPDALRIVDASDIIAGRPEEEGLQTLRIFSETLANFPLTEVNLSDNAMGRKGIEACSSVLRLKTLEVSDKSTINYLFLIPAMKIIIIIIDHRSYIFAMMDYRKKLVNYY